LSQQTSVIGALEDGSKVDKPPAILQTRVSRDDIRGTKIDRSDSLPDMQIERKPQIGIINNCPAAWSIKKVNQ
jgi:hypothetical protein